MLYSETQISQFKQAIMANDDSTATNKLLAVDLGLKRTGLAISDGLWIAAKPLAIIKANNWRQMLKSIHQYYTQHHCGGIVMGMPYHMNDSDSEQSRWNEKSAQRLQQIYHIPHIILWDERKTSRIAALHSKKKDDSLAATILLNEVLQASTY
jgi:putative Holliday junction resolvase